MPYIHRDPDGSIGRVFATAQAGYAEEWLPETHADVIALFNPPALLAGEVDAERDRRVTTRFTFMGQAIQLDEASLNRITAMGADARFAALAGAAAGDLRWADPDADFGWITTANGFLPLDALSMSAMADAAKRWVSRHTFAARSIKNLDPIPADFADDRHWPDPLT